MPVFIGARRAALYTAYAAAAFISSPALAPLYEGFVASGGCTMNNKIASNRQIMARSRHVATDDITALAVVQQSFMLWNQAGGEDSLGSSAASVETAIEYPEGTFTRVKFSGANAGSIPAGNILKSDYCSVTIPRNAVFWVRSYIVNPDGCFYLDNNWDAAGGEVMEYGNAVANKAMGGSITATGTQGYRPLAIVGMTRRPSVLITGDSRQVGFGDTPSGAIFRDCGVAPRALGPAGVGWCNFSAFGRPLSSAVQSNANCLRIAPFASDILNTLGVNDALQGRTAAQIQADLATWYGKFTGKKIWQATFEPATGSNNQWTDLAGQSDLTGNSGPRVAVNTFIRTSPAPLAGVFEIADAVENSRNGSKWKVTGAAYGFTNDGVHGNAAGYALAAAAIDGARFVRLPAG